MSAGRVWYGVVYRVRGSRCWCEVVAFLGGCAGVGWFYGFEGIEWLHFGSWEFFVCGGVVAGFASSFGSGLEMVSM